MPSPPRLHPTISAFQREVKPESSSAQGTLLMTWLMSTAASVSLPASIDSVSARKAGTRPMFPMNTKNAANVSSSP